MLVSSLEDSSKLMNNKRTKQNITHISLSVFSAIWILILLFSSIFSSASAFDQNLVHLGLVGEWTHYGDFHAVKVWEQEEVRQEGKIWVSYACCATSKGIVIFDIHSQTVASFIPIGECYDLEVEKINNEDTLYIYVAGGEAGLYIIRVNDPQKPFYLALYKTLSTAKGVDIANDFAYVADGDSGLQIIDISNRDRPLLRGSYNTYGYAERVVILNNYAYIADGEGGLQIIDISNNRRPAFVGDYDVPGSADDVAIEGNYAYVADGENGLVIIEISQKKDPSFVGGCTTAGTAESVAIMGEFAYVADGKRGLQIININDKTHPEIIGNCITKGGAFDLFLKNDHVYIACGNGGLQIIDVNNKTGPRSIESCETPGLAADIAIEGEYAYVADAAGGLQIIDITNKSNPEIIGSLPIVFQATDGVALGVFIADNYVYIVDGGGSLQYINIANINDPNQIIKCWARVDAYRAFIDGNYAYVTDWGLGNASGWNGGLEIIDITNRRNPIRRGSCETPSRYSYGLAVTGNYAFIADEAYGLQIIDIIDKDDPKIIGNFDTPGSAIGVAIVDDYAYIADGSCGLQIIDVSEKSMPKIVGSCEISGFAIDITISGDYAYVTDGGAGLLIIDISNKKEPELLGSCSTPGSSSPALAIEGDYAYVADWDGGLQIIDISNENGPKMTGKYGVSHNAYNLAIEDDYAFVVDRGSGLRIIDISNENGPILVGSADTAGFTLDVAIEGNYAYIANWEGGLQIFDISHINMPVPMGTCITGGYVNDVVIAEDYAFVADGDLKIIHVSDKNNPENVGLFDAPGARLLAIDGNYAYLANSYYEYNQRKSLLQIINISDKNNPQILGSCETPGYTNDFVVMDNYIYVADWDEGLQIIDMGNKYDPEIVGSWKIPKIPGKDPNYACGVAIANDYAFLAYWDSGIQIIDISVKTSPVFVSNYKTSGRAVDVAFVDDYVYIADNENGLLKLEMGIGPPTKGNLLLVAGGDANPENTILPATQALANFVFNTFINNGYGIYDIWYQNPVSFQDIDNDEIINQLVVDDSTPTKSEFLDSIINWAMDAPNTGPLYICLIGHGAEDCFQIMPNEILTAKELKECIHKFQNGYTDNEGIYHSGKQRQVVLIIESAASGTFIDDLMENNIIVITSTDDGPSFSKPVFSDSNKPDSAPISAGPQLKAYLSFTSAFITALDPYLNPENFSDNPEVLTSDIKAAFESARDVLRMWAIEGLPFSNQVPQMVLPGDSISSLSFSEDGENPSTHLVIDQDKPLSLSIIGKGLDGDWNYSLSPMTFFSSDPNIVDPSDPEGIKMTMDLQDTPWYEIKPKKNGQLTLIGYPDLQDLALYLTARIDMDVSIDKLKYDAGKGKRAVIIAGYKGSGDYLWESTNTIANHAYRTLRAMGYGEKEIYYYNPYLLQNLDGRGEYDEINGYPHLDVLNPGVQFSAFSEIKLTGASDLFIFFSDHGNKGSFCLNPLESLTSHQLIDWILEIIDYVDENIILLYDACYSGSFLRDIEERSVTEAKLASKLITITSTDPNQTAYYLNQGMVSFSYPFFDQWFLTRSLMDAFDYAKEFIPSEGQTPLISDPNIILLWDQKRIYYVDESRPVIYDPNVSRVHGELKIETQVYSLTGISEVWAMVETSHEAQVSPYGKAITEAPKLFFTLESDPNYQYGGRYIMIMQDPCPNETHYNLTIYAKDKGKRPKVASHKIAIGSQSENKTMALIVSSDPELFLSYEAERLSAQVARSEAILKSKGLGDGDIKRISKLEDLEIPSLSEGQVLFLYLIGKVGQDEEGVHFLINPNERFTPERLEQILDPNQQLLILMDAPYSSIFLSRLDWEDKKKWVGLASTNQGNLFFPIKKKGPSSGYSLFPCFSNFFFSATLSGATVEQAYWMAKNAVSLSRQMPELFLPGLIPTNYQTIHHYMNYYLGIAAIPGEEFYFFSDVSARVEDDNYIFSLTAHPDAQIIKVWVVLFSLSTFYQRSTIVDLMKDESQGLLYKAQIPSSQSYYKAYFFVEGRGGKGQFDASRNWTEWQEVSISAPEPYIEEDGFEPDDNPKGVLFDPNHEIIVNELPTKHTFFCEEYTGESCNDTDWVYFYLLEGYLYEIYAQDLSKYGYFIQLGLYDPNINLLYDSGRPVKADNYIAFNCPESGYYLLELKLASSYPPEGVEYILSVFDPQAGEFTGLQVKITDPWLRVLRVRAENGNKYYYPNDFLIVPPDTHYFEFSDLKPYTPYTIKIYEGDSYNGIPIKEIKIKYLAPKTLGVKHISIEDIPPAPVNKSYDDIIDVYRNECELFNMTPLPFGDLDLNLPMYGDYDGDQILNCDEVMFFSSHPCFPTIPLSLHKGINLFYFPSIGGWPNIIQKNQSSYTLYHYYPSLKKWQEHPNLLKKNAFNAIYASEAGVLYLKLIGLTYPILQLKGFLNPGYLPHDPNSLDFLKNDLFDPNHFDPTESILKILDKPECLEIGTISGQGIMNASWRSNYRFFDKPAGKDDCLKPYEVYVITNTNID